VPPLPPETDISRIQRQLQLPVSLPPQQQELTVPYPKQSAPPLGAEQQKFRLNSLQVEGSTVYSPERLQKLEAHHSRSKKWKVVKMQVTFGNNTITLQVWETKSEMLSYLSKCEAGSLILGEDADQEIHFYSAIVSLGWAEVNRFGVGICAEGHGLIPHLLLQPDAEVIIFGFNREVVGINVEDGKINFKIPLDSLFYNFLALNQWQLTLVIHEIGVVAITEEGKEIWRYDKDIIRDWVIEDDKLHLKFIDAPPVSIQILSGALAR